MGEVVNLVPTVIRTLSTRCFQEAVERYSRAAADAVVLNGDRSLSVGPHRDFLVDEWERLQSYVLHEMELLSASPAGLRASCASVVTRVFDAADARLRDAGYCVPRKMVCEALTHATPDTPVDIQ